VYIPIFDAPGLTAFRSVYADSSPDPLDDPKVETIVEMLFRTWVSDIGWALSLSPC
jgi:hypothetical protein